MGDLINQISFNFAKDNGIIIKASENDFVIYSRKDLSISMITELQRMFGLDLKLIFVSDSEFSKLLAEKYDRSDSEKSLNYDKIPEEIDLDFLADSIPKVEELLDIEHEAPVIRLINGLFKDAILKKASDIHIETFEKSVLIRFRIDGVLREVLKLPRIISQLLVSRVKVMASLDIAEKRLPQDGRISLKMAGRNIDIRISTIPASYSERIVMRILDKNNAKLTLDSLGMDEANLIKVNKLLSYLHGIILVTGPTGSGKTTSLYAMLSKLNKKEVNILTIEDPIEYDLDGIGQMQVNKKIDMDFAKGFRAILRQDPDIVMVGEIRDVETAEISVQASLTGHLVLSTLHTNSAVGAIARLKDMGVKQFLLSNSLNGIIAQRLVRKLCDKCKIKRKPNRSEKLLLDKYDLNSDFLYSHSGCKVCDNIGFVGRIGIYEILINNDDMKNMIYSGKSQLEIKDYLHNKSEYMYRSIMEDGLLKAVSGITTIDEVCAVVDM